MMKIAVIGAGLSGSTLSRKLAEEGKEVTIYERANFIGGQCGDFRVTDDMLIHYYFKSLFGPHIFHTNSELVWQFVTSFTDMNNYVHKVRTFTGNKLIRWPINLDTIEHFFGKAEDDDLIGIVKREIREAKSKYGFAKNFEEKVLTFVGETLYNNLIKNYTTKKWNKEPKNLSEELCKRIIINFDRDDRFFRDKYQGLPSDGYAKMFNNILSHKNIRVILNYTINKNNIQELLDNYHIVISTADINDFYDEEQLPYQKMVYEERDRIIKIKHDEAIINIPEDESEYFRETDYKKMWRNEEGDKLIYEKSDDENGVKLYPIPLEDNIRLSQKLVKDLRLKGIHSIGRLGGYKYINMDRAILDAINYAKFICTNSY